MFGMTWGALLLDETITWPMIAGCALVVGGTFAVVSPRLPAVRPAVRPTRGE